MRLILAYYASPSYDVQWIEVWWLRVVNKISQPSMTGDLSLLRVQRRLSVLSQHYEKAGHHHALANFERDEERAFSWAVEAAALPCSTVSSRWIFFVLLVIVLVLTWLHVDSFLCFYTLFFLPVCTHDEICLRILLASCFFWSWSVQQVLIAVKLL
jgi:hypothetical protein